MRERRGRAKPFHDTGPEAWILPLVSENGRRPDASRWWESKRLMLITGGDVVHVLLYHRDDDEELVPYGSENGIGLDDLPAGTDFHITHTHCGKGGKYDRVWTLDKIARFGRRSKE